GHGPALGRHQMNVHRVLVTLACAAVLGGTAAARQVFKAGTDLVLLNVTVADAAGHLVTGLNQEDFQVYEDGVLQTVTNFSREQLPIALSIALDTSTSMERKLPVAQEAAAGFVRRLTPRDVAQIIDFDSQAQILQPFTNDKASLEQAIRRTQAGGSTSLYNALYTALSELKGVRGPQTGEVRRQAIVALSDGEDTSSLVTFDDVLDLAKRSEVGVYAIGLREKGDPAMQGKWNEADYILKTLAQETGGRPFFVDDVSQLPAIYSQIADELANQYSVGYVSKNPKRDGAWRKITLRITRPNVTARTKAGYFGPKDRR
ncbi:MAG TPA: VWA domain-containing protein, partial [Vicinamibacterales bacterium]